MKDKAIVCNIGHFDNEIDVDSLRNLIGLMLSLKWMRLNYHQVIQLSF